MVVDERERRFIHLEDDHHRNWTHVHEGAQWCVREDVHRQEFRERGPVADHRVSSGDEGHEWQPIPAVMRKLAHTRSHLVGIARRLVGHVHEFLKIPGKVLLYAVDFPAAIDDELEHIGTVLRLPGEGRREDIICREEGRFACIDEMLLMRIHFVRVDDAHVRCEWEAHFPAIDACMYDT